MAQSDILHSFDTYGYAGYTPSLEVMVNDSTRSNQFLFDGQCPYVPTLKRGEELWQMTEQEGLRHLYLFLGGIASYGQDPSELSKDTSGRLRIVSQVCASVQEGVTFLGGKETATAISGLAEMWAHYLDLSDESQILLVSNPSTETGKKRFIPKSDGYIACRIISELHNLRPELILNNRIKFSVDELTAKPEETFVVLADDWVITGTQMGDWAGTVFKDQKMKDLISRTQIHLLAAPHSLISNGFSIPGLPAPIPVRAYYDAHQATFSQKNAPSHITGVHSSVGFGFATDIELGLRAVRKAGGYKVPRSPLMSVYRPYWPDSMQNLGSEPHKYNPQELVAKLSSHN